VLFHAVAVPALLQRTDCPCVTTKDRRHPRNPSSTPVLELHSTSDSTKAFAETSGNRQLNWVLR